jgi:hypothetical protein
MRIWGLALALTLVAATTTARADDSFDSLAANAQVLTAVDVAGMAWAFTAACDQGDGPTTRLCRQVRDRRAAALRAGSWMVDAEPGAFDIGAWDPDAKAVLLQLTGCIACVTPIAGLYIVSSKAPPAFVDGKATAAGIHQAARSFGNQAAADAWRTNAAAARGQFIITISPANGGMFELDGHRGIAVEIIGFRVYQPCDGAIVCASPSAIAVAADKTACGKIVEDVPTRAVDPTAGLPATLTAEDLKVVMRPVSLAAKDCFDNYGVPGKAKLTYTVTGAGSISAYEQTGDFVDTPTGRCVDKVAKSVTFPAVKKSSFTFSYPINVQ